MPPYVSGGWALALNYYKERESDQRVLNALDRAVPPVLAHLLIFFGCAVVGAYIGQQLFLETFHQRSTELSELVIFSIAATIVYASALGILDRRSRGLRASA